MSDQKQKTDNNDADKAAAAELEGVPESMRDGGADAENGTDPQPENADNRIEALEDALAEAQQAVLYAQAETQNVRRRLEKDAQDARAYAATGFARDMLSVMDNMQRALEAIPA